MGHLSISSRLWEALDISLFGRDRPLIDTVGDREIRVLRRGLVEGAYEAVKEMILDEAAPPGRHLNIDRLAPQLGISPTPLREALTRLEAEGLVVKQGTQGRYFVAPILDESGFEHLYEVRLSLEPMAAALAASCRSDAQYRRMIEVGAAMKAARKGRSYREYREFAMHDSILHRLVAQASGNPFLANAIESLRSHHQLTRLYGRHGIDAQYAVPEHDAIVAAIGQRNARVAERAMRSHIESSRKRLRNLLVKRRGAG